MRKAGLLVLTFYFRIFKGFLKILYVNGQKYFTNIPVSHLLTGTGKELLLSRAGYLAVPTECLSCSELDFALTSEKKQ